MCGRENAEDEPVSRSGLRALEEQVAELDEPPDEHEPRVDGERHGRRSEDLAEGVTVGQLH